MFFKEETISSRDKQLQEVLTTLRNYGDFTFDLENFQEYNPKDYRSTIPFHFENNDELTSEQYTLCDLYFDVCEEAKEFAVSVIQHGLTTLSITPDAVKEMNDGAQYFFHGLEEIAKKTNVSYQQLSLFVIHNVFAETLSDTWPQQQGVDTKELRAQLIKLIESFYLDIHFDDSISTVQLLTLVVTLLSHQEDKEREEVRKTYAKNKGDLLSSRFKTVMGVGGMATAGTKKVMINCTSRNIHLVSASVNSVLSVLSLMAELKSVQYNFWAVIVVSWLFATFSTNVASTSYQTMQSIKKHEIAHVLHNIRPEKSGLILKKKSAPRTQEFLQIQPEESERSGR